MIRVFSEVCVRVFRSLLQNLIIYIGITKPSCHINTTHVTTHSSHSQYLPLHGPKMTRRIGLIEGPLRRTLTLLRADRVAFRPHHHLQLREDDRHVLLGVVSPSFRSYHSAPCYRPTFTSSIVPVVAIRAISLTPTSKMYAACRSGNEQII